MGDCSYCKKGCGFGRSVHEECKIDHYESSIKRMDSGVGLTSTMYLEQWGMANNLLLTEIMDSDLEVLQSNFPQSGPESWLWMLPEVTVHLARPGQQILANDASSRSAEKYEKGVIIDTGHLEEYKKCLLGISDDAIYIRISQTPMRWALSKIGEVRTINIYPKSQWGFQVDIAEHVAGQSDAFMVSLCNDRDFAAIHGDWVKRLVTGTLTSQAPSPVQVAMPPPTSSRAEGKSIVEELRELNVLKTQGFLTEEEFNKAKAKILGS